VKRLLIAVSIFTVPAFTASAQTTTLFGPYDLTGMICGSGGPSACTFHFDDGFYWATGQYAQYIFTPPGAIESTGYFCSNPTSGAWTKNVSNPVPFNTPVNFTFTCPAVLLNSGHTAQMSAILTAHKYQTSFVCGVKVHTICHATYWAVDEGTFTITN